ncbi:unnamed protein product, partial [Ectocarpus sp. 12 AP-2014]
DPQGIPRTDEQVRQLGDSAHTEIFDERYPQFWREQGNVGGESGEQLPTSCGQWAGVIESKLRNAKKLGGVTNANASAHAEIHLSQRGRTVVIDVGPHVFVATGHGDQVIITNSWQGKHVIRNEPGMPRRQFLDGLHTILNSPDKAARQDASRAMFNCNTTAFDAAPASIQHMTVGDQGDPIVPNRNVNRSIEGIRQDRHPGAAVRNRDFDFRGGNYSTGDQVDATGDDEPFELCDYCRNRGYAACMKCL